MTANSSSTLTSRPANRKQESMYYVLNKRTEGYHFLMRDTASHFRVFAHEAGGGFAQYRGNRGIGFLRRLCMVISIQKFVLISSTCAILSLPLRIKSTTVGAVPGMVFIRLKAPFVSLIVTVLSTLAELALISFLLVVNSLYECKHLREEREVKVRNHIKRTRAITAISLVTFFVVEVVFSFFNDPVSNIVLETHACVRVANSVREKGDPREFGRAADVLLTCRTLGNGSVTQFEGNYSQQTDQVQCSKQAMYSHPIEDRVLNESISGLPFLCKARSDGDVCVFIQQRGTISLISAPFFLDDRPFLPEKFAFVMTELHFTPPSNLSLFAGRAVDGFLQNINGPAAIRRLVYSGAGEGNCTFSVVEGTATTVPLAMLITLAVIWGIAILLFLSIFRLKKDIFFDANNPIDWATRIQRFLSIPVGMNPVLTGVRREEDIQVQIGPSERFAQEGLNDTLI